MTRHRALISTVRSVIALLTAVLIALVGATALPAAAVAGGNAGQAKGHQSDRPGNGADRSHQAGKANSSGSAHKPERTSTAGTSSKGASSSKSDQTPAASGGTQGGSSNSGKSDQAHQSSGGSDSGASESAGGSSDKGDPNGNNGTVKLAGFDSPNGPGHSSGEGSAREHPSNDPHLPCTFAVEGFGFDAVASKSDLMFEQHAPTRGGGKQYDSIPLDQDSHSGGGSTAGYDGVTYPELTFVGEPHPKHGYHVKLTAYTPYSQGSDRKHKVFWVEPCESTVDETPPIEETPGEETPGEETPGEETPGEETPGEETPGEEENTELFFVEDSANPEVLGVQASVRGSQSAQAAPAEVPTAVESGLTGEEWSRSVLPLLAMLLGLATTFVALARRRAPVEADSRD
jgi:hypothetical protein